jgi:two-component system invasion response regulator UvrY
MKSILLTDECSIIRSGIKSLIKDICLQVKIDEAGNEYEIARFLKARRYDLIILDIDIPEIDFANLMNWIRISYPDSRMLIFSMYPEEIYGVRCMQMGAKGYLRKTASIDEIKLAIRNVLDGRKYISSGLGELILNIDSKHKADNPFSRLSVRELEIVKHLNEGKSLPGICDILKIQYSTANTYKRRIFDKLNVHTLYSLSQLMRSFHM